MSEKDNGKKQVLLRLNPTLYAEIAKWSEEDFRSLNGQIEYLLSAYVKKRRGGKYAQKEDEED